MFRKLFVLSILFGCFEYKKEHLRIVSLVPSATDIIYLLNADSFLVGISNQDNYSKEKVGDMINPDYEKIIKLRPSHVILTFPLHKKVSEEILKLGIDTILVNPESIDEIFETILKLGEFLKHGKRAQFIVDSLKLILDSLKSEKIILNNSVFYEIWDNPLWTAGNKTFINDALNLIGLRNIFDDRSGYFIVSEEEVIKRNPDIIIVAHSNISIINIKSRKFWNKINAIKNNKIILVDENLFNKPGPNIVSAIKFLKSKLKEVENE
ncbi:MAG: helical backbone metal receptor [candidate division WOR-3 bacterium]|nr:helical backbone metal receptor [candidate division WOR-3 bacterium]MCX7946984.1 helical backbone metal receptor [candidate division WOR-3 bacterium]MDW8149975.1 helical backbone metal receptor [candidate division WOR-3 bacterium]